MEHSIQCPKCNGGSFLSTDEGVIQLYKCSSCGYEFHVRVHYIVKPDPSMPKAFKATVDASDISATRKLQIKVKKVFAGKSNFYPSDLDKQVKQGLTTWDLGFYSESEIQQLTSLANEMNLKVTFTEDKEVE